MSSRRGPLVNNPNVANSPLRGAGAGASNTLKTKRPYANLQREDVYGQPPPKKQAVESRLRSPSKLPRAQALPQRGLTAASTRQVPSKTKSSTATSVSRISAEDEERKEAWKSYHKSKFPKMVFYFESVPDDVRARLTKRISLLGAVSLIRCFPMLRLTHFSVKSPSSRSKSPMSSPPDPSQPTAT